MGFGIPMRGDKTRTITLEDTGVSVTKRLRLKETCFDDFITVRPTRRGLYVGCTFITYDALDELVRISNEDK